MSNGPMEWDKQIELIVDTIKRSGHYIASLSKDSSIRDILKDELEKEFNEEIIVEEYYEHNSFYGYIFKINYISRPTW